MTGLSISSRSISSQVVSSCGFYLKLPINNIHGYHKDGSKFHLSFYRTCYKFHYKCQNNRLSTFFPLFWLFEIAPHTSPGLYASQPCSSGCFQIVNLLPQLPKCQDYMCAHLAQNFSLIFVILYILFSFLNKKI